MKEERKEDNQPRRFFRVIKAHFPPENKKFSLCGQRQSSGRNMSVEPNPADHGLLIL